MQSSVARQSSGAIVGCHGWWLPSLLLHETPTAEVRLKVAQSPERQLALFHDGTGYAPPCHPQPHKDPECTRRHRKRRSTRVALARARGRPCKCPAVRPSPGHVAQHQGRSEDSSIGGLACCGRTGGPSQGFDSESSSVRVQGKVSVRARVVSPDRGCLTA